MVFLIILMIMIFILPILAAIIYWIILLKKRYTFIDFRKCNLSDGSNDEIIEILTSTSRIVTNNVNAWLYLSWIYKSLTIVLDIWCASYSLMSLFILYNVKDSSLLYFLVSVCAIISLISSVLGLCLNPQNKYIDAITSWHKTSELTGKYQLEICKLLIDKDLDKIREITAEYQNSINEISNECIV